MKFGRRQIESTLSTNSALDLLNTFVSCGGMQALLMSSGTSAMALALEAQLAQIFEVVFLSVFGYRFLPFCAF